MAAGNSPHWARKVRRKDFQKEQCVRNYYMEFELVAEVAVAAVATARAQKQRRAELEHSTMVVAPQHCVLQTTADRSTHPEID